MTSESPFLMYFSDLMPRVHELIDKDFLTGATLTFPTVSGAASLHFTDFGMLMTSGESYSSKLISTWESVPVLHNIDTDDVLGPVEFVPLESYGDVQDLMKRCGELHLEVPTHSTRFERIVDEHYAAEFSSVVISIGGR